MGWRDRRWTPYQPRPKVAKLSTEQLGRQRDTAVRFIERSKVLSTLVERVELTRGRVYVWRDETDLMARITPLSSVTFLLEAQRGNGWSELAAPFAPSSVLWSATGLAAFTVSAHLRRSRKRAKRACWRPCTARSAFRSTSWPSRVSGMRFGGDQRSPSRCQTGRVLVRFSAIGPFGSFGGTCLYARREGEWGCYVIKPSAAASLASAEAWLNKRSWEGW